MRSPGRARANSTSGMDGPEAVTGAHDFAVDNVQIVSAGLHQFGGELQRLATQLGGSQPRCLTAHHRHARGECAEAFVYAVGLAVYDINCLVIDAERIGADLRHRGFDALTDGSDAGDELDIAIRLYFDADGVGGPKSALLDEHRNAGADQFAFGAAFLQIVLQGRPTCEL